MNETSTDHVDAPAQDGGHDAPAAASGADKQEVITAPSPARTAAGNGAQPAVTPSFWTLEPIPGVVDAFLLGWKIVELHDRLRIAAAVTRLLEEPGAREHSHDESDSAAAELGGPMWMTSIWHANLKQIASTHAKAFPDATTSKTLYEPPGGRWDQSIRYLYPQLADPADDYTAIGIGPGPIDGANLPQGFSIYDVARRAVNTLAILFARSKDSIIETTIGEYQTALFQQMIADGSLNGEAPAATPEAHETLRRAAIASLSATTAELLEDWASFLREQYYAGSTTPAGATKLQAFEAGRNLARLTWSISAETVGMETSGQSTADVLAVWQKVFEPYGVVQAQHFITALCGAMDDQYRQSAGNVAAGNGAVAPSSAYDPNRPSSMGTAIARCLDHWQAGVAWLGQQPQLDPDFYKRLRVALIQQSDTWQSLLTGRVRLDLFTVESVMSRLAQEALHDIQAEVEADVGRAAAAEARQGLKAWLGILGPAAWLIVAAIGVAVLLVVITLVFVIVHPNGTNANGAWAALSIGSLGAWAAALLGLRSTGSSAQSGSSQPSASSQPGSGVSAGLAVRVNDAVNLIETSTASGFKAAYAQLRLELAALNYATGLSYPLIEAFVMHTEPDDKAHGINAIRDDFSFMTKVIWTTDERWQEVEDVVRAALGPVGLLSGAAVRKNLNSNHVSGGAKALKQTT